MPIGQRVLSELVYAQDIRGQGHGAACPSGASSLSLCMPKISKGRDTELHAFRGMTTQMRIAILDLILIF